MSTYKLCMFVLILCFVTIRISADMSLAQIVIRQEKYKNSTIYFDHKSQKNGTLDYMFCKRTSWNMSCTIFREVYDVVKLSKIATCQVSLKAEKPFIMIGPEVRIFPLNPNKALILWVEIGPYKSGPFGVGTANNLKYTRVDYDTCNTTDFTLSTKAEVSMSSMVPIFYPSGEKILRSAAFVCFSIFCEFSYHDLHCGIGFCKRAIDKNTGEIISEAEYYYKEGPDFVDIIPIDHRRLYTGCIFFDWEGGKLYKYKYFYGLDPFLWSDLEENWEKFRYSVRFEIITICKAIEKTKVYCKQLNIYGHVTMRNEYDLKKINISPVPYTWRGGGYLLLTTECDSNCTEPINRLYSVDTEGHLEKVHDIMGFQCNLDKFKQWHTFFEKDQGKHCVVLLCYDENIPRMIQVHCFNLSENIDY